MGTRAINPIFGTCGPYENPVIINPYSFAVAGGGTPWSQIINDTGVSFYSMFQSDRLLVGGSFVASGPGPITVTQIMMSIIPVGEPIGKTYKLELWSDSSGSPGTLLAASASTNFPSAYGDQTLNMVTPYVISPGSTYWVVIRMDQLDASNYLRPEYLNTGSGVLKRSANGSSWTTVNATADIKATLYGTT